MIGTKELVRTGAPSNTTAIATANRCGDLIRECLNTHQALVSPHDLQAAKEVLRKTATSSWQSPALRDAATESARGFALSTINGLPKQAGLHMQQLQHICNLNLAQFSMACLKEHELPSKPFAMCSDTSNPVAIKGHGYIWHLQPVDLSGEIIPSQFLERLALLRSSGVEPDQLFVGVPYAPNKPSLGQVAARNAIAIANAIADAADKTGHLATSATKSFVKAFKMPDPVLLVGFGKSPCVLVEIGRWI